MYEAGAWVLVESAIADLPADLRWLFESGAVTIEQLAAIYQQLGATCAADLGAAVARRAIRSIPGLDDGDEAAVAAALPTSAREDSHASRSAVPSAIVDPILALLRGPRRRVGDAVGSLRRGQDIGRRHRDRRGRGQSGRRDRRSVASAGGRPRAPRERAPPVPAARTRADRRALSRSVERRRGVASPDRLARALAAPRRPRARSERRPLRARGHRRRDLRALGLPFIPPEIRNGDDEIAGGARRHAAALVSRADIRGDLHMHSSWSDGRDSIEAMVSACRALGYEYMAITDHSPHSAASRNLTRRRRRRGRPTRSPRCASGIREIAILHGCEVDILPDGRLDFPDRVLERFDIVLASLHERAGQAPDQLLERYARRDEASAGRRSSRIRPTASSRTGAATTSTTTGCSTPPSRPARSSKSTARRRTSISTARSRAAPSPPARRSSIDSDCHRAEVLGRQMELGVTTARRGWVEPRHVLNTRPLAEVRALHRRASAAQLTVRRMIRRAARCAARRRSRRSRCIARRCCPASTSATPDRFRRSVGSPLITPRDGYPLYFAIGRICSAAAPARSRRTR